MNRRSLLTALLGAAGSAATGVSPRRALSLAKSGNVGISDLRNWEQEEDPRGANIPTQKTPWTALFKVQDELQSQKYHIQHGRIPARIAQKKSWSPAYKEIQTERALRDLDNALQAMSDKGAAERIARALGLWP